MTAIAPVSPDMTIGRIAAIPATPVQTVPAPAASTPDKRQADPDKPTAASEVSSASPLLPRTITLSDVTTGILIQTDQDPRTGETIAQFPDRALLESYAQQIRLQGSDVAGHSMNS